MVTLLAVSYHVDVTMLVLLLQKSSGGVLLPKSAVKFERYLTGEVRLSFSALYLDVIKT